MSLRIGGVERRSSLGWVIWPSVALGVLLISLLIASFMIDVSYEATYLYTKAYFGRAVVHGNVWGQMRYADVWSEHTVWYTRQMLNYPGALPAELNSDEAAESRPLYFTLNINGMDGVKGIPTLPVRNYYYSKKGEERTIVLPLP